MIDVVDCKTNVKDYTWDHEYRSVTELKVFKQILSECTSHSFLDKSTVCIYEGLPSEDESSTRHLNEFWRANKG